MRRPWSSAGSTSWKPCPSSSQLQCYLGIVILVVCKILRSSQAMLLYVG